jgi:hypothetical protein
MQRLEVSGAVRPLYGSLGVRGSITQHAKRMRTIILSSVAGLAVPYVSTLSQKSRFSKKSYWTKKNVCFDFSSIFVWDISHTKKTSGTYCHIAISVFMHTVRCSCQTVVTFEYSPHSFESSDMKFHGNLSSGSWVIACERTGRRTDGERWRSY